MTKFSRWYPKKKGKKKILLMYPRTVPTLHKKKFPVKHFFSKCKQIYSFLWIWSYLLKKSLMENFISSKFFLCFLNEMYYLKINIWYKFPQKYKQKHWYTAAPFLLTELQKILHSFVFSLFMGERHRTSKKWAWVGCKKKSIKWVRITKGGHERKGNNINLWKL